MGAADAQHGMTIRCLTLHAEYACRRSGACCTAGWPIPIEADRAEAVSAALNGGRLAVPRQSPVEWLGTCAPAGPAGELVLHADEAGCIFFDRDGGHACAIHRAMGHDALPLACREFPRVSVVDPRGTSVTLSHYCPTAASLLEIDGPLGIVENAPAFPEGTRLSGLDASSGLPPLVRPEMLMDWASWWEWERRAVELFARPELAPDAALALLADAVERVRGWSPADGPLAARIDEAFRRAVPTARRTRPAAAWMDDVLAAVPEGLRPAVFETHERPPDAIVRRMLAAHAFANWTAHLGQGLRTWLASLDAVPALVERGLGVRQTDLLLRHLADPYALARRWSVLEN